MVWRTTNWQLTDHGNCSPVLQETVNTVTNNKTAVGPAINSNNTQSRVLKKIIQ